MSDADSAFDAARKLIRSAKAAARSVLDFSSPQFRALTRIPEEISGLSALQELYLDQTEVSDLTPISGLSALQWLDLNRTKVSDLAPISGLKGLQELSLDQTKVSDLTPISGLPALQRLYLNQTKVSNLVPISGLSTLQELYLNQTKVSDLAAISGLSTLQELYLTQTMVSDLTPISGLSALQRLVLTGAAVKDLRPIAHLDGLVDDGPFNGLYFKDIPATQADPELARLARIDDNKTRARDTLAYLRSLPPDDPEPEPVEPDDAPTETRVDQAATRARHLLQQPAVTRMQATIGYRQIVTILDHVPLQRNTLPPVFAELQEVSCTLSNIAGMPLHRDDPESQRALEARIRELEQKLHALTRELEAAREDTARAKGARDAAMEALRQLQQSDPSFWSHLTGAGGRIVETAAAGGLALVALMATHTILGDDHPLVVEYHEVMGHALSEAPAEHSPPEKTAPTKTPRK